jgi:hypothetical protein
MDRNDGNITVLLKFEASMNLISFLAQESGLGQGTEAKDKFIRTSPIKT